MDGLSSLLGMAKQPSSIIYIGAVILIFSLPPDARNIFYELVYLIILFVAITIFNSIYFAWYGVWRENRNRKLIKGKPLIHDELTNKITRFSENQKNIQKDLDMIKKQLKEIENDVHEAKMYAATS